MNSTLKHRLILLAVLASVAAVGAYAWTTLRQQGPGEGFVSGNGRIEATEIDVAAKLGGRVQSIVVKEGDFVTAGQPLVHMQIDTLQASHDEARARHQQAVAAVANAEAQVAVRESDRQAALALVAQRQSELDAAQRRLARSQTLVREGASSDQEVDDDRARERSLQAAVVASRAQAEAAQAAITAARTQVASARAAVTAAQATVARIKADIDDSALVAPRSGRVQYRIAQPGEVIGGGGKVLNLVDLSDVYMTFFLPEPVAGRLALGSEVRIVLDAAPQLVIPAKVSFVASTAQFTPKTVETASERQKMMFRVKAQIAPELLQKHVQLVKTGLPGMAWLKLDANAPWPGLPAHCLHAARPWEKPVPHALGRGKPAVLRPPVRPRCGRAATAHRSPHAQHRPAPLSGAPGRQALGRHEAKAGAVLCADSRSRPADPG
ncbi:MAG: hemolysin D [Acidovorax sp. 17-64-282]|nr:MAG: hemolysin D [Acidovorax sp. 17-64-282]